jgi:hypothetical protein
MHPLAPLSNVTHSARSLHAHPPHNPCRCQAGQATFCTAAAAAAAAAAAVLLAGAPAAALWVVVEAAAAALPAALPAAAPAAAPAAPAAVVEVAHTPQAAKGLNVHSPLHGKTAATEGAQAAAAATQAWL